MREIPLTQGQVAFVDDADYELVAQHKWYAHKDYRTEKFYVHHRVKTGDSQHRIEPMHQLILGTAGGQQVDHKDGNPLNNCRSNLRVATFPQNGSNRGKTRNNTSGYKGVSRKRKKWRAVITVQGKFKHIGTYSSALEAARAYDAAARLHHGEFANTNF